MKPRTQKEALTLDKRKDTFSIVRGREAEYMDTNVGRMVDFVVEKKNKGLKKW